MVASAELHISSNKLKKAATSAILHRALSLGDDNVDKRAQVLRPRAATALPVVSTSATSRAATALPVVSTSGTSRAAISGHNRG